MKPVYDAYTVAKFWSKVDVGYKEDCWMWRGAVGGAGKTNQYGRFRLNSWQTPNAHRIAWEIYNNERLGKRFACHTCDNTLCVNPHHLYAGDRESNTKDGVERGRYIGRGNKRKIAVSIAVSGNAAAEEIRPSENPEGLSNA
jgi:hypothetical protein